ncbi:MAG TPA: hypothetical protein VNT22_11410 [Baekduia sp.]|nr:hypothetical protein [Baekduia sp.]
MTHLTPGRATIAALLAAIGAVAIALLLQSPAPSAGAASNPNNLDCQGRIEPGEPGPVDDEDVHQVKYTFACSGPITGYSIQLQRGVEGFDTEAIVLDKTTSNSITTDSFSCNGDIPGLGFNCVGFYSGGYNNIIGQFSVGRDLRKEPRINPRLVVATASISGGKAVQALSGPFQLGRPLGVNKKKHKKSKAKAKAPKKAV